MSELDGVWEVRRIGGALPPLYGVRKRISGDRGETLLGPVPVSFDVDGLELRYRPPLAGIVDRLEPSGTGYRGTTTLLGREIGRFELSRPAVRDDVQTRLIRQLDEAHAMEQGVSRLLGAMIGVSRDPQLAERLEQHRGETRAHAERLRRRLEAHGTTPSLTRQAGGVLQAAVRLPLGALRSDDTARLAREAFATEHLEIASYELLRRVAELAGDEESALAAREILAEEEEMARFIAERWDLFAAPGAAGGDS